MVENEKFKWVFRSRFRRHAFGWKSQPAIQRIKEAIAEIKKVARKDPTLAGEGAVVFFERLSPAIEHVDSSSGYIGNTVNWSIEQLAPIISAAPIDDKTRHKWLERLWEAYINDGIPYLDYLPEYWGDFCSSKEIASKWADDLMDTVKLSFHPEKRGYFKGTTVCFSALLKAQRYQELLDLLTLDRLKFWHYQQFAVKTLAALGKIDEAIAHAEICRQTLNTSSVAVSRLCEEILLAGSRIEEAYLHYAIEANLSNSNLSTFRAIAKKYPQKEPAEILNDLVESTPGQEGKWFATAKELKLFEIAIQLANITPCDPRTLTRAARDYVDSNPAFAMAAGQCALHWLVEGYGYEITSIDVLDAYTYTMHAGQKIGQASAVQANLRNILLSKLNENNFVTKILSPYLVTSQTQFAELKV